MDKADDTTKTQRHIHVYGDKGKHWSQNEDGSPHDKNKNDPGDPPNSVKKDLKKMANWDWDAKAKQYADKFEEHTIYYDESGSEYFWVNNGRMFYSPTHPLKFPSGQGTKGSVRVIPRFVIP